MRSSREEVVHAHEADALVHLLQHLDEHLVAGRRGQHDVERLVEQHEVRVGLGWRGRRPAPPPVAQRQEGGGVVPGAVAGGSLHGLQLEAHAHLVEVAHQR